MSKSTKLIKLARTQLASLASTNTDIARALGRTYQAVSQHIHRLRRQEGRPR